MESGKKIRVRFAPSPTGLLHVGGARTALFNWLFARRHGGVFLLRLEDTDRERSSRENEETIIRDLQWLGLDWDEGPGLGGPVGPYRQTERVAFYKEHLNRLLEGGGAYRCFCSQKDLEAEREACRAAGRPYRYTGACRNLSKEEVERRRREKRPFSVRLRVPEGRTVVRDLLRGDVEFDHAEFDDLILVRTGGEPTFNFVNVVDDALMGITHVLRGDDHLTNTPKQILLYRALGFEPPQFGHMPLILGPDKAPLSKRHGAVAVGEFRRRGYLPEALLNYLALLGWSLDDKTELFTREELVRNFSLERVKRSPAVFDYAKLQWMNGHYIRKADPERIYQLCLEYLWEADAINESFMRESGPALKRMIETVKGNLKTVSDVGDELTYFLGEVHTYDSEGLAKHLHEGNLPVLERAAAILEETVVFNAMELEQRFRAEAEAMGRKFGDFVHPLRLAITGRTSSPNLFELIEILGRGRCVVRLRRFAQMIRGTLPTGRGAVDP